MAVDWAFVASSLAAAGFGYFLRSLTSVKRSKYRGVKNSKRSYSWKYDSAKKLLRGFIEGRTDTCATCGRTIVRIRKKGSMPHHEDRYKWVHATRSPGESLNRQCPRYAKPKVDDDE